MWFAALHPVRTGRYQGWRGPRYSRSTSRQLCDSLSKDPRKMALQAIVVNYFNYFTEIEEHFQRRRGGVLLLSTLDWALIEIWKDAGIPLEAALRGIDAAFDR